MTERASIVAAAVWVWLGIVAYSYRYEVAGFVFHYLGYCRCGSRRACQAVRRRSS
jgi:hypothetical protein